MAHFLAWHHAVNMMYYDYCLILYGVVGMEPRALRMLRKYFTEPQSSLESFVLNFICFVFAIARHHFSRILMVSF